MGSGLEDEGTIPLVAPELLSDWRVGVELDSWKQRARAQGFL